MTTIEDASISRGLEALDSALACLGKPKLLANPDFIALEPFAGVLPQYELRKRGAAPFQFIFATELEVSIGVFSEVLSLPVPELNDAEVTDALLKLLTSRVRFKRKRWMSQIQLLNRAGSVWRDLKVLGAKDDRSLASEYEPYVALD